MDNRPIGVFDSGLGGLTAVKALVSILPGENIIYFGDTGRIPYGTRSKETILKYTRQAIDFLLTQNVKLILVACGTVSTTVLDDIKDDYPVPILGVARSAAVKAVSETKNKKIGLIATTASVKSRIYDKFIREIDPECVVYGQACPLLVHMVENGRINPGDKVCEMLVSEYLAPIKAKGIDTLILGCTHFPLLSEIIKTEMGENISLVDPGVESAGYVNIFLENTDAKAEGKGLCSFYVSDSIDSFAEIGSMFLGSPIKGKTERIDVSVYGNGK